MLKHYCLDLYVKMNENELTSKTGLHLWENVWFYIER